MKTLAISLINWNSIKDTIECIESLLESQYSDFDVFVVDNGSSNNEGKILYDKYYNIPNIIVNILDENIGFTGGNNFNINIALKGKYKYFLLLNNDTIIPKTFLGYFIQKSENINEGGVFGPEIRNINNTIQSIGNTVNLYTGGGKRYKVYNKNNKIDYVSGSCFLIKRHVLENIGLLNDIFFAYYEESDFCLKVKKSGFSINIIPNIFIFHKEEIANKKSKHYYCYLMFRNRIIFLKKHSNIFQYLVSYLFLVLYLIIFFPINFGFKNYKYAFFGISDGIKNKGGKPDIN